MICYPSSALVGPYKSISYTHITNCTIIIFTRNNTNVASLGAVEILSISIKLKEEKYVSGMLESISRMMLDMLNSCIFLFTFCNITIKIKMLFFPYETSNIA